MNLHVPGAAQTARAVLRLPAASRAMRLQAMLFPKMLDDIIEIILSISLDLALDQPDLGGPHRPRKALRWFRAVAVSRSWRDIALPLFLRHVKLVIDRDAALPDLSLVKHAEYKANWTSVRGHGEDRATQLRFAQVLVGAPLETASL